LTVAPAEPEKDSQTMLPVLSNTDNNVNGEKDVSDEVIEQKNVDN